MQTFLPFPDFRKSLESLDNSRLNKQNLETKQILNILTGVKDSRWKNHPAVRMWRGYEDALKSYYNIGVDTWIKRGKNSSAVPYDLPDEFELPSWFGSYIFHMSHQSNLLHKNETHYRKEFGDVLTSNMPYFWPVEIKCKHTGKFDDKSGFWVKINSAAHDCWYKNYLDTPR